jgi:hypothetical protein
MNGGQGALLSPVKQRSFCVKVERKKIHVILTNDQVVHFDRRVVNNFALAR